MSLPLATKTGLRPPPGPFHPGLPTCAPSSRPPPCHREHPCRAHPGSVQVCGSLPGRLWTSGSAGFRLPPRTLCGQPPTNQGGLAALGVPATLGARHSKHSGRAEVAQLTAVSPARDSAPAGRLALGSLPHLCCGRPQVGVSQARPQSSQSEALPTLSRSPSSAAPQPRCLWSPLCSLESTSAPTSH